MQCEPSSVRTVSISRDTEDYSRYGEERKSRSSQRTIGIVLNVLTTLGVAGTLAYVILTYSLWKQAGENFRAQQKAWVSVIEQPPIRLHTKTRLSVFMDTCQ